MTELEQASELINDSYRGELNDVANLLATTMIDPGTKIKLHDFEEFILPYIIGDIEQTEDNYQVFVANYIALSGKATSPIIVVDNDDEAVKIYKLPPMVASLDIDVVTEHDFKSMHGSQRAEVNGKTSTLFKAGLQNYVNNVKRDETSLAGYAEDLERIHAKYKRNNESVVTEKVNVTVEDPIDDYGDFLD